MKRLQSALVLVCALVMMAFTSDKTNEITFDNTFSDTEAVDNCTNWQRWQNYGKGSYIYLKVCERPSGGSGYYKWKNTSNKPVRISFKLNFRNGKSSKGSTNIKARSETNGSSCFSCARKNSGLRTWEVTKIAFKGEKGYW